jgi:exosortase
MTDKKREGLSVPLDEWQRDLEAGWRQMPYKGLFLSLLVIWIVLFHFLGNSTFGYKDTPSLFGWMNYAYNQLEDDRHCKYVPFVVLALFWWKRKELMVTPKAHWWPAIGLVVSGLVLHLLGFLVQQTRLSIVAFFVGLYGLTGLVWGKQWLKVSFFPFFLFAFCLPVGTVADALTFPLRILVAKISAGIGYFLGSDIIRQGSLLFNRDHTIQYDVAPACSGIRSLTALLALTTIYAFVFFRNPWKRLIIIGLSAPLAVVWNVLRVTGVWVVADVTNDAAKGLKVHDYGEFVFFLFALICVLAAGSWLGEEHRSERHVACPEGTKDARLDVKARPG